MKKATYPVVDWVVNNAIKRIMELKEIRCFFNKLVLMNKANIKNTE